LEVLFLKIGKPDRVSVVLDKFSGQSRGFAFVQMTSRSDAARAIAELDGVALKGRNIKVSEAREAEPRSGSDRNRRGGGYGPGGGARSL